MASGLGVKRAFDGVVSVATTAAATIAGGGAAVETELPTNIDIASGAVDVNALLPTGTDPDAALTLLRMRCYGFVIEVLEQLRAEANLVETTPITPAVLETPFFSLYRSVLAVKDALAHDTLYRWLSGKQLKHILSQHTKSSRYSTGGGYSVLCLHSHGNAGTLTPCLVRVSLRARACAHVMQITLKSS
ncbi:MAG: hypothetical protein EOO65_02955 [Methanosarcinales archaeon]|nr:MAG: hypothetical protein EOO65_02955 [Methanosarcinales archaeon]